MRIAFLTHEPFFPPSGGGSAEAVYLVQEMVRRGHEVHLFCPALADPERVSREFRIHLHEFRRWKMGRYARLRNFKYVLYPFFLQRMVARVSHSLKFDLLFAQHAIAAVAAGRLRRWLGTLTILNFLDYLTGFMETWPPYLAPPPFVKRLTRFELSIPRRYAVDGVLTVSDTLADYFSRSGYPRERIQPIYYGYDAALFPYRGDAATLAPPQPPVVVMHGSLDHHHLRTIALEAFRRVASARADVRFRIVGHRTEALERFLQRATTFIAPERIECPGFVAYASVAEHLATAAVGVVPYEESTGTHCAFVAKIVEYLAIGLPVVSTALDSAQRYFRAESRVRFTRFDGTEFAEAILKALEPVESRDLQAARSASERVRRELDWPVISHRALDFVDQLRSMKSGRTSP
jgi:glycosyltransferase involved in cell wall biosynthesis